MIDITGDDPETNFKWKAVQPASPVNLSIVKVEKDKDQLSLSSPPPPSSVTHKRKTRNDSPDLSPPRNRSPDVDISPPRRKVKKSAPTRGQSKITRTPRNKSRSPDLSPPRKDLPKNPAPRQESTDHRSRLKSDQSDLSPPRHVPPPPSGRTLSGSKAGLQTGDAVKEEVNYYANYKLKCTHVPVLYVCMS